jgi:hypothetical protein
MVKQWSARVREIKKVAKFRGVTTAVEEARAAKAGHSPCVVALAVSTPYGNSLLSPLLCVLKIIDELFSNHPQHPLLYLDNAICLILSTFSWQRHAHRHGLCEHGTRK